jgi:hypothetical protein
MKLIKLTKGFSTKVDDDKYDFLMQWKWHYSAGYARRNVYYRVHGKRIQIHIHMHQVVSGLKYVDHRNNDKLDNQAHNLRASNHSTNGMNMKKQPNKSSIYKGVTNRGNSYRTVIWKDNEKAFDVSCTNERWAAYMYDLNASALFGEFFRPNFPNAILVSQE